MNDTKGRTCRERLGMFEIQEVLDHVVRAERVVVFIDGVTVQESPDQKSSRAGNWNE